MGTGELVLVSDDIGVVQFLHDVDLLVDVLLQEGLLLDVQLADDLDSVQRLRRPCISAEILFRASITSPKAPFPIDFTIS